ncbi:hypothetical protein EC396_00885 [Lutibacter sp. HS1-25]|uniref:hypothetical protein n=1 Tax=Lutibacter sp. HS1-25 TaxID=2485000 RepID=UPI001012177D|nr:hypothetical protein [Lutibacter sp. HS1-25]RXP64561.1 hypothetical protein EC396_00885 [Lutibacter sp. HS1-25]
MNKLLLTLILLCCFNNLFAQVFTAENGNFMDLKKKKIKLYIENSTYSGTFQNFTSKRDKKEYFIFTYFSRTVIFSIDKPLNSIQDNTKNIGLECVRVLHATAVDSIIKTIHKNGINSLKDYIVVYESEKFTTPMRNNLVL